MAECTVILTDGTFSFNEAKRYFANAEHWAKEHCESFVRSEILWVGDVSTVHDIMSEYEFEDEREAFLFKLRWV